MSDVDIDAAVEGILSMDIDDALEDLFSIDNMNRIDGIFDYIGSKIRNGELNATDEDAELITRLRKIDRIPSRCLYDYQMSCLLFRYLCLTTNFSVQKSSYYEDTIKHIDYHVTDNGIGGVFHRISNNWKDRKSVVDVKTAYKFMYRQYTDLLNEWIWIELNNINGGPGWLYGKSDYIVEVFLDQAWWLDRLQLVDFIERRNIKDKEMAINSSHAQYKPWTREAQWGHKDIITHVSLRDIKNELNPEIMLIQKGE